ncbi:hypothetical protein SU69_07400 [Thermosipho melanesiensis]|uniref:DUF4355 domain-containing protein n=2 Tax=Thermosipho melanesiensis TaxID=46541 RepID=A6LN04_THEM4|nr:DUF4355 domain-containing protein [Thermosipho melanesiensis]ABR31305.1 hypothetical protein Tmel_1458 [Thermosipho melanesiensis BI429]APT74380.1 hypothetical protein BW47_07730 [Thermosipho melanesiensis]OOC36327.1 hypothetical protein SU68_07470 [Thermosipho melanesiensis]OOC37145.1 hypothetical protein SU69_07400 [Thermosipho melanesiensis]OOC37897.1 hypothetical protein SU70_07410 [Thermosipho melanesiensis]
MLEMKKRGIDIQLFAEGDSQATQNNDVKITYSNGTSTANNGTPSVNVTFTGDNTQSGTNEEVLYDDKDPIEALKATAIELGLNPDDVAIMTKKELQSQIDRAVTQAIKTREEKLKKKAEIEKMKEKGQYEQLLRQERREALEDLKNTYLQAKGLPQEFGVLITVDPLVDKSLTEAKEELVDAVETIATKINEIVEAKVNEKLKTMESGTFTGTKNTEKALPTDPKEALKQLFSQKKK